MSPEKERDVKTSKKKKLKKHEYSFDVGSHLKAILGVDLTEIPGIDASTALKLISEIGTEIKCWPTAKHFCAWLGLCPGTRISGGRNLGGKTTSINRGGIILRMAANSLYRSETAYGVFLRKMKSRKAPAQAVTALAHKMARAIYVMMKTKEPYKEAGVDYYDKLNTEKTMKYLQKRASSLGYSLVKTLKEEDA